MRVLALASVAVALGVGAVVAIAATDGDDRPPPRDATTTSSGSSPTTTAAPADDTATAVWPIASSSTRYASPADAARGFAVELVGFTDPVVGELRQGDSRSGEIDVAPYAAGPVTTVFVRQLGSDDSWWVLGSATANIQVSAPEALAVVRSPVALAGTSTAFEATVSVQLREDGGATPLGEGIVMGGANGEMGPFTGSLEFRAPTQASGALIFFTLSAEDGRVLEASVLRVHFA
jgi:hypothetical protein